MPNTKPFSEIPRKLEESPEFRLQSAERRRAMDVGLTFGKLRDAGVPQSEEDSLEHDEGVYLATLRESIELLGGRLEIRAVFPDRTVELVPASDDSAE